MMSKFKKEMINIATMAFLAIFAGIGVHSLVYSPEEVKLESTKVVLPVECEMSEGDVMIVICPLSHTKFFDSTSEKAKAIDDEFSKHLN